MKSKRKSLRKSPKRSSKNKIILRKSHLPKYKFVVTVNGKQIHFGSRGYSDYNHHKDYTRYKMYKLRHRSRENWTKSGINTAGFWSRWILWNLPSFRNSIKDTEKRFNIKISYRH